MEQWAGFEPAILEGGICSPLHLTALPPLHLNISEASRRHHV